MLQTSRSWVQNRLLSVRLWDVSLGSHSLAIRPSCVTGVRVCVRVCVFARGCECVCF